MQADCSVLDLYNSVLVIFRDLFLSRQVSMKTISNNYSSFVFHLKNCTGTDDHIPSVYCSFAGDACTALESFEINPYNNSLSSILPCNELLTAESILHEVSEGIHRVVNRVKFSITAK